MAASSGTTWRLIAGFLLLGVAWAFALPPFAHPDEAEHYSRAQGIASGELIGRSLPVTSPGTSPAATEFLEQTTREVEIPAGRSFFGFTCVKLNANTTGACQDPLVPNEQAIRVADPVGAYSPLPYLAPAAVSRIADRAPGALRWQRLASFAIVALLLAGAIWCAAPFAWLLIGLVLAVTPAALAWGTSIGGSGMEIAGAVTVATALLALGLGRRREAGLVAAAAGIALIGGRALGPLWLALVVAACLPLSLASVRRIDRRALIAVAALIVVAIAAQRLWESAYGAHPHLDLVPDVAALKTGVRNLPTHLREAVGGIGSLEYLLPWALVVPWVAAVLALLAAAAWRGSARERWLLAAVVAVAVAVAPLLFAVAMRFTGFGVQARYVMPAVVIVPLIAGAIAQRRGLPIGLMRWVLPLAAVIHFAAFWVIGRRYAVGADGPLWFIGEGWSPPLGWIPWLLAAVAGATLLADAGRRLANPRRPV